MLICLATFGRYGVWVLVAFFNPSPLIAPASTSLFHQITFRSVPADWDCSICVALSEGLSIFRTPIHWNGLLEGEELTQDPT